MPLTEPLVKQSTRTVSSTLFATADMFNAVSTDMIVANDGAVVILVQNKDSDDPHTLTVAIGQTIEGQTVAAKTYSIPKATMHVLGPFPPEVYNQRSGLNAGKLVFQADDADLVVQLLRIA